MCVSVKVSVYVFDSDTSLRGVYVFSLYIFGSFHSYNLSSLTSYITNRKPTISISIIHPLNSSCTKSQPKPTAYKQQ